MLSFSLALQVKCREMFRNPQVRSEASFDEFLYILIVLMIVLNYT